MAIVIETSSHVGGRHYPSAIRWTAIMGGLVAGMGSYLLLALLGAALGLSVIEPRDEQSLGAVPIGVGVWTVIISLIASFIGGYVAARMSGLARSSDGLLHGFVTWATTTILFAFLATTAISSILGGTFSLLGNSVQQAGGSVVQSGVQRGDGDLGAQLERIITGTQAGSLDSSELAELQNRLRSGDRNGAASFMINQMGFSEERANLVADQATPLFSGQAGQQARQVTERAIETLAATSWWLFVGLGLSLITALAGGMVGTRSLANRTRGDHVGERRVLGT